MTRFHPMARMRRPIRLVPQARQAACAVTLLAQPPVPPPPPALDGSGAPTLMPHDILPSTPPLILHAIHTTIPSISQRYPPHSLPTRPPGSGGTANTGAERGKGELYPSPILDHASGLEQRRIDSEPAIFYFSFVTSRLIFFLFCLFCRGNRAGAESLEAAENGAGVFSLFPASLCEVPVRRRGIAN
jgi:hypothetical protein